ncbi:MAG: CoA transferase [Chloroflexi bacterium]|nr:CoA transferase [Chloroflexota bacterium]
MSGALEGLRVVEFSNAGAGRMAAMDLAHQGAQVLHVVPAFSQEEGRYPAPSARTAGISDVAADKHSPAREPESDSYSLTLNLARPRGLELARQLIAQADVVMESFPPGVMSLWGLAHEDIAKSRPDAIVVSLSPYGQRGPFAALPADGNTLFALSGLQFLTGWTESSPALAGALYVDGTAAHFAVAFILAALDHRLRTGRGQYIDLSQYQCTLHCLQEALLEASANGRCLEPLGNRHPYAAPCGVYRCRGEDRWIAISVVDHQQWSALCQAMGKEEWMQPGAQFRSVLGRLHHQDELDRQISTWTQLHSPEQLMATLQAAGVPAGVVASPADLLRDPQLRHRSYPLAAGDAPFPMPGQHNELVFRGLLGLDEGEFLECLAQRAFG